MNTLVSVVISFLALANGNVQSGGDGATTISYKAPTMTVVQTLGSSSSKATSYIPSISSTTCKTCSHSQPTVIRRTYSAPVSYSQSQPTVIRSSYQTPTTYSSCPTCHQTSYTTYTRPATYSQPTVIRSSYQAPTVTKTSYSQPTVIRSSYQTPTTYSSCPTCHQTSYTTYTRPATYSQPTVIRSSYQAPTVTKTSYSQPTVIKSSYQSPTRTSYSSCPTCGRSSYTTTYTKATTYSQPTVIKSSYQSPTIVRSSYQRPTVTTYTNCPNCQKTYTPISYYQPTVTKRLHQSSHSNRQLYTSPTTVVSRPTSYSSSCPGCAQTGRTSYTSYQPTYRTSHVPQTIVYRSSSSYPIVHTGRTGGHGQTSYVHVTSHAPDPKTDVASQSDQGSSPAADVAFQSDQGSSPAADVASQSDQGDSREEKALSNESSEETAIAQDSNSQKNSESGEEVKGDMYILMVTTGSDEKISDEEISKSESVEGSSAEASAKMMYTSAGRSMSIGPMQPGEEIPRAPSELLMFFPGIDLTSEPLDQQSTDQAGEPKLVGLPPLTVEGEILPGDQPQDISIGILPVDKPQESTVVGQPQESSFGIPPVDQTQEPSIRIPPVNQPKIAGTGIEGTASASQLEAAIQDLLG